MKVGPRNAMVIAVARSLWSLTATATRSAPSFGSAGPVPGLVTAPLAERDAFPELRGGGREPDRRRARHRRVPPARAAVLTRRALERCLALKIELTVNGERQETEVWEGESLLFALRERLGLPGSKNACEQGECGSCSVLLDGTLVCACLVLAAQADGHEVVTVEGSAARTSSIRCSRPSSTPARCSAASARRD